MKIQTILDLKFNMARFGMCSLIEANQIDFAKILYYQDKIIDQMNNKQETVNNSQQLDEVESNFL